MPKSPSPVALHGHIDVRTYDGYISDAKTERLPNSTKYVVIGIYRKISDPLPDLRVRAFLEVIASRETRDIPKEKSWYALNEYINGVKFAASITKHPWLGLPKTNNILTGKRSTAAGRYQITLRTYKNCIAQYGASEDFCPTAQNRLAVMILESRQALGLIRENKLKEAVSILNKEWVALPGTEYDQGYTIQQLLIDHNKFMLELL